MGNRALRLGLASALFLGVGLALVAGSFWLYGRDDVDRNRSLARARLEKANEAYDSCKVFHEIGVDSLLNVYISSKLLLKSELAIASGAEEEATAFGRHLHRMESLEKSVRRASLYVEGNPREVVHAEYYVAEARVWNDRLELD